MANRYLTTEQADYLLKKIKRESEESASGQKQPDWDETDSTSLAYVRNKPQIESVTLTGNKSFADLGLEAITNIELAQILT